MYILKVNLKKKQWKDKQKELGYWLPLEGRGKKEEKHKGRCELVGNVLVLGLGSSLYY